MWLRLRPTTIVRLLRLRLITIIRLLRLRPITITITIIRLLRRLGGISLEG